MTFRLIRILAIAFIAYSAIAFAPSPAGASNGCDLSQSSLAVTRWQTERAAAIFKLVNQKRADKGVAPLSIDKDLWMGAMWEASYILKNHSPLSVPCGSVDYIIQSEISGGEPISAEMKGLEEDALYSASYHSIGVGSVFGSGVESVILLSKTPADEPPGVLPVAHDDNLSVNRNAGSRIGKTIKSNDENYFTFVSAHALHGWTSANDDISYIPNPGFHGVDVITYTIADLYGRTSTALARVTVGDGKQVVPTISKTIASKSSPKPSPSVSVMVGAQGNKVILSQINLMYVSLYAPVAGKVKITIKSGKVILAHKSLTLKLGDNAIKLTTLIPASKLLASKTYTLVLIFHGHSKALKFRVI